MPPTPYRNRHPRLLSRAWPAPTGVALVSGSLLRALPIATFPAIVRPLGRRFTARRRGITRPLLPRGRRVARAFLARRRTVARALLTRGTVARRFPARCFVTRRLLPRGRRVAGSLLARWRTVARALLARRRGIPRCLLPGRRGVPRGFLPGRGGVPRGFLPGRRGIPRGFLPRRRGVPRGVLPRRRGVTRAFLAGGDRRRGIVARGRIDRRLTATLCSILTTCTAFAVAAPLCFHFLTGSGDTAVRAHDGWRLARLRGVALRDVAARHATRRRSAGRLARTGRLRALAALTRVGGDSARPILTMPVLLHVARGLPVAARTLAISSS